jgi:hypothetical protein
MTTTTGTEPTQVQRPWRATVRTILQVGIPAILALPAIVQAVVDELGGTLPPNITAALVAVGAVLTALAALLARLMAIPAVEVLFRRLPGAAFAAQPRPKPDDRLARDDERYGVADPSRACSRANGIRCGRHDVDHWREKGLS